MGNKLTGGSRDTRRGDPLAPLLGACEERKSFDFASERNEEEERAGPEHFGGGEEMGAGFGAAGGPEIRGRRVTKGEEAAAQFGLAFHRGSILDRWGASVKVGRKAREGRGMKAGA